MINISMNTSPVFSDGESAGSLMIVNEDIKPLPHQRRDNRNDSGEVIYTSKAVPVGSKIESDKLDVDSTRVHTNAPQCSSTSTPTPAASSARRAS